MQKRLSEQYLTVLQEIHDLYEQLLQVIEMEKSAVLASNINALISATAEKQGLLARLAACQKTNDDLTRRMAAATRSAAEARTLNLAAMIALVDPEQRGALERLGTRLRALLKIIREKNKESRLIVQHCLSLVQNSMSFFTYWNGSESVYGASGAIRANKGARLLSNNA